MHLKSSLFGHQIVPKVARHLPRNPLPLHLAVRLAIQSTNWSTLPYDCRKARKAQGVFDVVPLVGRSLKYDFPVPWPLSKYPRHYTLQFELIQRQLPITFPHWYKCFEQLLQKSHGTCYRLGPWPSSDQSPYFFGGKLLRGF